MGGSHGLPTRLIKVHKIFPVRYACSEFESFKVASHGCDKRCAPEVALTYQIHRGSTRSHAYYSQMDKKMKMTKHHGCRPLKFVEKASTKKTEKWNVTRRQ